MRWWCGLPLALGCGGGLLTITVREESTVIVEKGTVLENLVSDLGFGAFTDLDLIEAEELENQGVEPGDVQEVYLVDFVLEVLDPPEGDLSFVESLDVLVSAPGLPEVVIAHQDDFPPGSAEVAMVLEPVDLTPYVVSRSMSITTDVRGHRPQEDTTVEGRFAVEVGVTRQGVCNNL
jgi:hypothetical protein